MDSTAKIWDIEMERMIHNLKGHSAEVISLSFTSEGDRVLTGSFDSTAKIWDLRTGECILTLEDH